MTERRIGYREIAHRTREYVTPMAKPNEDLSSELTRVMATYAISPAFLAFCRDRDCTPEEGLIRFPAGSFGDWLRARWTEFDRSRGLGKTPIRTDAEHDAFEAWLARRTAVASYTLGVTTFTARLDDDEDPTLVRIDLTTEDGTRLDYTEARWDGEQLTARPRAISPIEADEVAVLEGLAAGLRAVTT